MATKDNEILFQPLRMGAIELPHRIAMAPLTRARSTDRVPNALMAEYYSQRSSAALIISEATAISEQGYGWHGAPGIYTDAHVAGWRNVTDAVHKAGGRIFLQLWHMGAFRIPTFKRTHFRSAPARLRRMVKHIRRREKSPMSSLTNSAFLKLRRSCTTMPMRRARHAMRDSMVSKFTVPTAT